MIGVTSPSTGMVVMLNDTWFWPGATVTVAGTFADNEELDKFTTRPPKPAFAVNVTRPCSERPPIMSKVESVSAPTQGGGAAGLMVREAEAEFADVAVMVAVVVELTGVVLTGKLAVFWPCGTVTVGGVVADGLLLPRFTGTPPAGALALSITVPVALSPPVTDDGTIVNPVMVPVLGPPEPLGGVMVKPADTLLADVAVIVALVVELTGVVVTGNVAEVCPAGTVTVGGTPAAGLLLDNVAVIPSNGAGDGSVRVPVAPCPPVTDGGAIVSPNSVPVPPAPAPVTPTNARHAARSASVSAGHKTAFVA